MKKIVSAIMFILLLLITTACSLDIQKNNTIKNVELTDREELLVNINANNTFMFEYKADKEYKEFEFWIEKYESGVKVDDHLMSFSTSKGADDEERLNAATQGTIIFNVLELNAEIDKNRKQTDLVFYIANDTSTKPNETNLASAQGTDVLSTDAEKLLAKMWSDFDEGSMAIDGEMLLASIMYNNGEAMMSLSEGFYSNSDIREEYLKNYDVAYLFKAEFKK